MPMKGNGMLLNDAIKTREATRLSKESQNIVLRPIVAAQLIDSASEPIAPENEEAKEYKVVKSKPKTRKPRKTRAKKGK